MAHPQDTRDKVRRAYVFDNLPLEQAAEAAGVAAATARRWKDNAKSKGDDWDKMRAAHTLAGGSIEEVSRGILSGFLLQYQATIKQIQDSKDILPQDKVQFLASLSDAFNKTVAASRRVLPETNALAVAMQVVNMLADYIKERDGKLLADFVGLLEGFGELLVKEFGS